MEFKDRVAENPNRIKLTYEDGGASVYANVELADNPIEEGTPLNKNTFDKLQKELNAYVVGNVLITSTNENPSTYLGGSWELIDKGFKSAFIYNDKSNNYYDKTVFVINGKYLTENNGIDITRVGHNITFRLNVTINDDILSDQNVQFGTLNFENIGCSRLAFTPLYPPMAFEDGTGNGAFWSINNSTGKMEIVEDLRQKGFKSGDKLNFQASLNIPMEYMIDSFCDKFYWKRTS